MARITIVDEQDNILCYKEKHERLPNEIFRCAAAWIVSPDGDILLARRSMAKKIHAGKWAAAVTGHVDEGESYEEAVIREAREELGIEIMPREFKKFLRRDKDTFFSMWFVATVPKEVTFSPDPSEVMETKWWTRQELQERIRNHPEEFVPTAPQWFEYF